MAAMKKPGQDKDAARGEMEKGGDVPGHEHLGPYPLGADSDSFFMGPGRGSPSAYGYGSSPAARSSWAQLPSALNLLAGGWLLLSPMMLYPALVRADSPAWNDMVVGVVIALFAMVRLVSPRGSANLSWINFVLGGWLIASPFVLSTSLARYPTVALWNEILVGAAVMLLATWSALRGRHDRRRERTD